MAVQPLSRPPGQRLTGSTPSRRQVLPTRRGIARRRVIVTMTKWLLPLVALLLLGAIAAWPEISRVTDQGRITFRRALGLAADSARMLEPRYHGANERGQPYTLSAASAVQVGPERVNLEAPKGDVMLQGGSWMLVQSKTGVFVQHRNQLDLSDDVQLYRDDGVTMRTESATVDLKSGAATSAMMTHAEGPFGQLDAQGFTLVDKGAVVQFQGPARLILNEAHK